MALFEAENLLPAAIAKPADQRFKHRIEIGSVTFRYVCVEKTSICEAV